MASKSTVNRQKSANMVISAGETHKARVGEAMGARYGASIVPAIVLVIELLVARLKAQTAAMVEKDDAHEEELRDDPEVRAERDAAAGALYSQLVEIRQQLEALFGPEYVAKLGFSGRTTDDPVAVSRLAETVAANLETVPAPAPRIPGVSVDKAVWLGSLVPLSDTLSDLVSRAAAETREAEATLVAKNDAIDAFDNAFSDTANLLSTVLRIAGEDELARRVRPSSRRPGQTNGVAEDEDRN